MASPSSRSRRQFSGVPVICPQREKIVITGIAGRLGRLVARRLHREGDGRVVGIDRRPFPGKPRDIEHVQVDLRSKKARDVFRSGDVRAVRNSIQSMIQLGLKERRHVFW